MEVGVVIVVVSIEIMKKKRQTKQDMNLIIRKIGL